MADWMTAWIAVHPDMAQVIGQLLAGLITVAAVLALQAHRTDKE